MTIHRILAGAVMAMAPLFANAATLVDSADLAVTNPYTFPLPVTNAGGFAAGFEFTNSGALPLEVDIDFSTTIGPVSGDGFDALSVILSDALNGGSVLDTMTTPDDGGTLSFVLGGDARFVIVSYDAIKNAGFELTATATPVPLPAALPMIAAGMAALGFVGARRRKA
jgi:hypothetical protein